VGIERLFFSQVLGFACGRSKNSRSIPVLAPGERQEYLLIFSRFREEDLRQALRADAEEYTRLFPDSWAIISECEAPDQSKLRQSSVFRRASAQDKRDYLNLQALRKVEKQPFYSCVGPR